MTDLTELNKLEKYLKQNGIQYERIDTDKTFDAINEAPTVDAVPVVRCKDCKFSSPNQVYGCRIHSFADDLDKRMYADDYCSYAERKED